MGAEPIVNEGKDAVGGIYAGGVEIKLGTSGIEKEKYNIIKEEGGHYYKGDAVEASGALDDNEQHDCEDNDEIREIAKAEKLAPEGTAQDLAEDEGRLASEEGLLNGGQEVVLIGQHGSEMVDVGIPVGQQDDLEDDTELISGMAGAPMIEEIE